MPEVSRPWENSRAGSKKVGEQKKCYGFYTMKEEERSRERKERTGKSRVVCANVQDRAPKCGSVLSFSALL